MGIFKRRGSRSRGVAEEKEGEEEGNAAATPQATTTSRREQTRTSTRARRRRSKRRSRNNAGSEQEEPGTTTPTDLAASSSSFSAPPSRSTTPTILQGPPTWEMVPRLITDLETAPNTHGEQPARALRMLFALSEQHQTSNRTKMVREQDGKLVMVLLDFLRRCERGSSEQYLSLLVLNNITIPAENKRIIALHCNGAHAFAKLLCEDPSCHLLAIILVNLTFCEADLRRELVLGEKIQLLESLAYALRVSSLSLEEYEAFQPLVVADEDGNYSPRDLLQALMEEDRRLRPTLSDLDTNASGKNGPADPSTQLYPETARWCLSALKNLTRPPSHQACNTLIETGVVPLIMKMITVNEYGSAPSEGQQAAAPPDAEQAQTQNRPTPDNSTTFVNSPAKWDSNSMQDAALFVISNLAVAPSAREVVREAEGVALLTRVANYWKHEKPSEYDSKVMQLQCLKARMALACLVGSEGHFGQPRLRGGGSVASIIVNSDEEDDALKLEDSEADLLLQLLADTMHGRAREGAGGYSAATFHVKWVLFSLRCLLTNTPNQVLFAVKRNGAVLNTLLIKILAQYALVSEGSSSSKTLDAEAASHAAFSLYLQSNYGFRPCKTHNTFLPALYDNGDHVAGTGSLAAKILTSYIHMEGIPPAGRHAADQLLLRLHYLKFGGTTTDLGYQHLNCLDLEESLLSAADSIVVEKRSHGARPRPDIFDRCILRSRVPKKKNNGKRAGTTNAPWGDASSASIASYPSALHATQALSFGSAKVRHLDAIDDVAIANNIANSANGEKTESYNYWWIWQDASDEVQKHLQRQTSQESALSNARRQAGNKNNNTASFLSSTKKGTSTNDDGPLTIFGFTCGPCN